MPVPIKVPTLGESVTEAIIANWKFADGDYVQLDDVLVELETDKVSVEVAASQAGILSIGAKPGDTVAVGDPLGTIDETAKKAAGGKSAPTAKASKTATGESKAVNVPTLGESVTEAIVANWKFADGDNVKVDDVLVELETDKVSVEVASPAMGVLSISAQPGTNVAVGALLANVLVGASGNAPAAKTANTGNAAQATPAPVAAPQAAPAQSQPAVKAGPAVRQAMRQQGIAPQNLTPSGLHGNILASDLQRSAVAVLPAFASSDSLAPRPMDEREERVKLSKLRQTIALRLKEAQNNAALLTTFNEVNLTKMIEIRKEHKDRFEKKHGVRLGFMSFFSKAAVIALKEFPATNAEIYGDEIIYKNYYDIGVAVGSKQGLVVPVIRNVDQLSFAEIEKQIYEFGSRAQAGALTMDEMRGGTFTITNGGVFGSLLSTPIVNPPQSAILGMHKIQKRPIVENDEIVIADVMYLAMTYDHRIIDGREAVSFLVRIKELLETPERLLLDI